MKPIRNRLKFVLSAAAISGAILLGSALPLRSQEPAVGREAAVSDVVNQHIHAIALRTQDVTELIAMLPNDTDTIGFESSTGYDQGVRTGVAHTHRVELTRPQLIQLLNTNFLIVESQTALNHTHQFRFLQRSECPVMASPIPSLSPSPSPSATPTVSPEPTVTPQPTLTILSS